MAENKLEYKFSNDYLTIESVNNTTFYIHNTTAESIAIRNDKRLSAEQLPDIDENIDLDGETCFYFYFDYGNDANDAVKVEDSANITMSLLEGEDQWSICQSRSPRYGVYWKLCPIETIIFEPNKEVIFSIDNINCINKLGRTDFHIRMKSTEIIDSIYTLTKVGKPIIEYFKGPTAEYNVDDMITLKWNIICKDYMYDVILDDEPIIGTNEKKVCAKVNKKYILKVTNKAGYVTYQTFVGEFRFITSFQIENASSDQSLINISWSTKNTEMCTISNIGNVDLTGKASINRTQSRPLNIKLIALKKGTSDTISSELSYNSPLITSFSAHNGAKYMVNKSMKLLSLLDNENEFISPQMLKELDCSSIVQAVYGGDEPPSPPPPPPPPTPPMATFVQWKTEATDYVTTSLEGDINKHKPDDDIIINFYGAAPTLVRITAVDKYGYKTSQSKNI